MDSAALAARKSPLLRTVLAVLTSFVLVLTGGFAGVASVNAASLNRSAHSTTKDGSLWQIVNKKHPFHKRSYVPKGLIKTKYTGGKYLKKTATGQLGKMYRAAKKAGVHLRTVSAYRSYKYQKNLYKGYVRSHGKKAADTFSARPGYSEHQTGLALDIGQSSYKCTLSACFGKTKAGKWLAKNAWKYGFVLRFPKGQQKTTGYVYEPWHYRYLGKSAAKAYHKSKAKTLEKFFKVSGGTKYKK